MANLILLFINMVSTASTGPTGAWIVELDPGLYMLPTTNYSGYADQIHEGIVCDGGSAFSGACDPLLGTPVEVVTNQVTSGLEFRLDRPALFRDGFESGTTAAWSATLN